jgi:hypothetical protein
VNPRGIRRICVVACNPGPIAAAVFDVDGGAAVHKKLWTGGARPAWVWTASRSMPTLVVDAALPTLADGGDDPLQARQRMARIGMDGASDMAAMPGCVVAVRGEAVAQICALALAEGIVADAATSFTAVELGTFIKENGTGDGARLVFHEKAAFLMARNGGRLTARRFAMPSGAVELASTLQLLPGVRTTLEGLIFDNAPVGTSAQDRRTADAGQVTASLLERAANLWLEDGALAAFAPLRQKTLNAARRWLPTMALALAILCAAAALPLVQSLLRARAQERLVSVMQTRQAALQARATENAPIMQRIEALSRAQNARVREAALAQHTLASLVAVQDCMKTARRLRIDRLGVDEGGRHLIIAGTVDGGHGDDLSEFVARLGKSHFKPSSDVSLHEDGGALIFALGLEEQP